MMMMMMNKSIDVVDAVLFDAIDDLLEEFSSAWFRHTSISIPSND
jgi:hypothetical protein